MSLYLIGDLQGCHAPFQRLLDTIDFSPSRDTVYILGDLVNRGPDSLKVLRSLSALGDAAQCLLGNHDLHLLAVSQGVRKPGRSDTVQDILEAKDSQALLGWLRHRAMAIHRHGWLMVHAGVLPQWTAAQTVALGSEVEQVLRGNHLKDFLQAMYGNTPDHWSDSLQGNDRLRVIVNALTRLRFCTPEGVMDFSSTDGPGNAPEGHLPWFDVPGRATLGTPVAFGHWSTLATGKNSTPTLRNNTLPLDTGCVWGGCLTAARLGEAPGTFELVSVKCEQAQKPGKPGK
ncbi:Bis(5'nucleosyl)-tetraphosphatase, ApaH [Polaromonas sp. YR568]|uniref:symmetrical bis(5'-nucleosyl)-tetraphosphatase n=1 Tax=Polaromonas sp. YR568 TaxID=1855301 RepID=UPI0008E74770|nr:symmetrical bis(5'-nucleosyl)-tetraphosphatase [Polaromonas sp. YR568]SFU84159.1 Bis(5'nucleosyl)-tetraphosphatase, ApaH [Polaromonas sp. YR568]